MNNFIITYLVNYFKSGPFLRYIATMIAQALAAKLALDATQTGALQEWLLAGLAQAVAFAPVLYQQFFGPSKAATEVAVQADKIMAGDKPSTTVKTPPGVPDIKVTNVNANTGHS